MINRHLWYNSSIFSQGRSFTTLSLNPLILKIDRLITDDFISLVLKHAKYTGKTNVTRYYGSHVNDYVLHSGRGRIEGLQPFEVNISKLTTLELNHQKNLQVTSVKSGHKTSVFTYRPFAYEANEARARMYVRHNVFNTMNEHFASIIVALEDGATVAFNPNQDGRLDCSKPEQHFIGTRDVNIYIYIYIYMYIYESSEC